MPSDKLKKLKVGLKKAVKVGKTFEKYTPKKVKAQVKDYVKRHEPELVKKIRKIEKKVPKPLKEYALKEGMKLLEEKKEKKVYP